MSSYFGHRVTLIHSFVIHYSLACVVNDLSQPEGLQLSIRGETYKFQGALLAFVGDTPASQKVGGFKEGVGFAERKCRHCMATLEEIQEKVRKALVYIILRTQKGHIMLSIISSSLWKRSSLCVRRRFTISIVQ